MWRAARASPRPWKVQTSSITWSSSLLGARDFEEQDRASAETVAHEAANADVRQIVYLGGLGADDPDASPHLRSRRETGQRLAAAGVPVTTLRAAEMIVGEGEPSPSKRSSAWSSGCR